MGAEGEGRVGWFGVVWCKIHLTPPPGPQPTDAAAPRGRRLVTSRVRIGSMVSRIGPSATTSRQFRQARKGATVAVMSGAEVQLVRAASIFPGDLIR